MDTPKIKLTVAFFQQDIVWEDPESNFKLVESALTELTNPVDVIVVPETFTTGFGNYMARLAESPEGKTYDFARRIAAQYDALFVGTWPVRDEGQVYNRMHWVRPDGSYGYYDKSHTFRMSSEGSQLARGVRKEVFEWRGWHVKPAVCYDLRFPTWLRNSAELDYDLMLVCANWPGSRHEAWSTLLKARAIENLCYVIGTNRVGEDGVGIPYTGNSAAVDYKGMTMVDCASECQQLRQVTLDYSQLRQFRMHWPFYLDFD